MQMLGFVISFESRICVRLWWWVWYTDVIRVTRLPPHNLCLLVNVICPLPKKKKLLQHGISNGKEMAGICAHRVWAVLWCVRVCRQRCVRDCKCKCAHASETCTRISKTFICLGLWFCTCLCARGKSRTQMNIVFIILWACVFMGMCFFVYVYLGMHRMGASRTFSCITSDTSCTAAMTGSCVRFNFCVSITAHGGSGDITSRPRCRSGRIEGEAGCASPTCTPILLLSSLISYLLSFSHSSLPVFLSDAASSDFEKRKASRWETSVSECKLEPHLLCLSCVWVWNQSRKPEFPNRVHSTGAGLPLPYFPKHKTPDKVQGVAF